MAKNRNKKKKGSGAISMDITEKFCSRAPSRSHCLTLAALLDLFGIALFLFAPPTMSDQYPLLDRKLKKGGRPMKRSKNVRKTKAISKTEQSAEKILKNQGETTRIHSAKTLYESYSL
ncbi:hypothetical protein SDJN02_05421 [Cucurbita argyrosperma subsp. argyrosperma]|nr:hypothetical protein SDJN02_05421 [Cucurbita argyrosperma subsp. argyrosperma]